MFKRKLWIFAQSVYSFDVANDADLFAFNVVDVAQTFCLLATRSHIKTEKNTSIRIHLANEKCECIH